MDPRYALKLYVVKNYKIANNSTTTVAGVKKAQFWGPKNIRIRIFEVCLIKWKIKFYLYKINHWYLLTTKEFTGWNVPLPHSAAYEHWTMHTLLKPFHTDKMIITLHLSKSCTQNIKLIARPNVCRETGWLLGFVYIIGQVAYQCC